MMRPRWSRGERPLIGCWDPASSGRESRRHDSEDLSPADTIDFYWREGSFEFTFKLLGLKHGFMFTLIFNLSEAGSREHEEQTYLMWAAYLF